METRRVVIADNQPLTAFAIEQIVRKLCPNVTIVTASRSLQLTKLLKESDEMTVVILDYTLFDFVHEEKLAILADSHIRNVNWLLVSEDLTSRFLRYMLYNTVNIGVVFKDDSLDTLKLAIRNTMKGERYVSQHVTQILLQQAYKEEQHKDDLTQTEREVLKLIAQGKTTKEIAAERFSSIHTINSHRKNIFRKLNVNCAHDAIKYALRSGLVEESDFYI